MDLNINLYIALKVNLYVKVMHERFIANNIPLMDMNANLHLTLKPVTLKVNINDTGCNG